jgi:hypothetical protein
MLRKRPRPDHGPRNSEQSRPAGVLEVLEHPCEPTNLFGNREDLQVGNRP